MALLPIGAFARDDIDNKAEPAVPTEAEAPIALLIDVTSGQVLHEREADRRFVPASITKAMTTFLAFELLEEGNLDPRQVMTIRPDTWREWSGKGSTMWLPADARVTVDEMLTAIANVSANDASVVLAEGQAGSVAAWTAMMNAKARELGMVNSHFGTPNGWPDEGRTFTSARDLAKLADAMVSRHPQKFARYVGKPEYRYNNITQYNRNPMIGRVQGADGIKTGYTNEAASAFSAQPSVMVKGSYWLLRVSDHKARVDGLRAAISNGGFRHLTAALCSPAERLSRMRACKAAPRAKSRWSLIGRSS